MFPLFAANLPPVSLTPAANWPQIVVDPNVIFSWAWGKMIHE
jgi:hypothetical protein